MCLLGHKSMPDPALKVGTSMPCGGQPHTLSKRGLTLGQALRAAKMGCAGPQTLESHPWAAMPTAQGRGCAQAAEQAWPSIPPSS